MILKVDNEGRQAVEGLCDIALKAHGMQVLQSVLRVLQGVNLEVVKEDGNPSGGAYPRLVDEEGSGETGNSVVPN